MTGVRNLVRAASVVCCAVALAGCLSWQQVPLVPDAGQTITPLADAEVHTLLRGPEGAPAVVLVHGFASSTNVWMGLIADLETDHRVLALDLKGFGWTSRYEGDYSRRAQADLVLAAMDAAGIQHADLVAHSMGSAITLTLAAENAERVDRVVLVGPWTQEAQVPWAMRDARRPGIGEWIFGTWYEEHLAWRIRKAFADPETYVDEAMLDRGRQGMRRPGSRAAALATIRGLDLPALEASFPSITQPVLIVQGAQDSVARPEFSASLATRLPAAEYVALEDVGHFPMIEASAKLGVLVRGWFDGVER